MKIAVIYNQNHDVLNVFGMQNQEKYSIKSVEKVASSLEEAGHNVRIIDGNKNIIDDLEQFMPKVVQGENPGMVFNLSYGIQGVSRYVHTPSMLEMLGVPYVGSSPAGHGVALDKVTSKVLFEHCGLPTPRYYVVSKVDLIPSSLTYPLIIKLKMEAVSLGISIVHNEEDLKEASAKIIREFNQPALVEEFIPGREFAVGLLGNRDPEIFPVVEIDLGGDPFGVQFTDDKINTPKNKICPADLAPDKVEQIQTLAVKAFNALGVFDFARVDFRMDEKGELYILELNSMASLGLTGSYLAGARAAGYSYESLINRMLDVACVRYFGSQKIDELAVVERRLNTNKKMPLKLRYRSHLRSNIETMVENLSKMTEFNTYYANVEGINSYGRWLSNKIEKMGFNRLVIPRAEFGNIIYFANHQEDRNDVLLIASLDHDTPFSKQENFFEKKGEIGGCGTASGKGGIAILLGALNALRYTKSLSKVKCALLFISDSSMGGKSAKKIISDYSNVSNVVLGLNSSGRSGELITQGAGELRFKIDVSAVEVSSECWNDNKALQYAMKRISSLDELNDEYIKCRCTSFNSQSESGQSSVVALSVAVRYLRSEDEPIITDRIYSLFGRQRKSNLRVNISKSNIGFPYVKNSCSEKLYLDIEQLAKKLEVRVKCGSSDGFTPMCYVSQKVPSIDGLGPIAKYGLGPKERIVKDSLIDRGVLLASIIRESIGSSFRT